MERGQGKNQRRILVALKERAKSPRELMRELFSEETASNMEAVRRALRQLAKAGLVKSSDIFTAEDGSRCWLLANAQVREPRGLKVVK